MYLTVSDTSTHRCLEFVTYFITSNKLRNRSLFIVISNAMRDLLTLLAKGAHTCQDFSLRSK